MPGVDFATIRDTIASKISATGGFQHVIPHDLLSAPTTDGLVASFVGSRITPSQLSGLAAVTMRLEIVVRVHLNALLDPPELIDTLVFAGADAIMGAMIANWRLDGVANVRNVDVLGEGGDGMRTEPGYLDIGQTKFRCIDVFIPVLVNDAWDYGS